MNKEKLLKKAKPICFDVDEIKAVLRGFKTVEKQLVMFRKGKAPEDVDLKYSPEGDFILRDSSCAICSKPPKYMIGDILYVKEPFANLYYVDSNGYTHYDRETTYYAADGDPGITLYDADGFEEDDQCIKWKSPYKMHKSAARIFLRVTDMQLDRVQNIMSEPPSKIPGFIKQEGFYEPCLYCYHVNGECKDFIKANNCKLTKAYIDRWNKSLSSGFERECCSWDKNPWVWVYYFEVMEVFE